MALANTVTSTKSPAHGYDMVAQAAETRSHPSPAEGTRPTGVADGSDGVNYPGAALGTGMNTDIYTLYQCEAV